jgi:hypothetical protein
LKEYASYTGVNYEILKRIFMFRDNVPTVELALWNLGATLFEGEVAAGPVPVLFSDDPEASLTALESGTLKAHSDLQKIARTFFMPETVQLAEALNVVKKPRY